MLLCQDLLLVEVEVVVEAVALHIAVDLRADLLAWSISMPVNCIFIRTYH